MTSRHFIISCFLCFCFSAYASVEEQQVASYDKIDAVVQSALSHEKPEDILMVFDNDNTLQTLTRLVGSEAWLNWQMDLLQNQPDSPFLVVKNQSELWELAGKIFTITPMRVVEPGLPTYLSSWQQKGIKTIILTARSPNMFKATNRELARNHLDIKHHAPQIRDEKASQQHYQSGIIYTNGKHKGEALEKFIQQLSHQPKLIIFVDDRESNIAAVVNTFKEKSIPVLTIRYTAFDRINASFIQSSKLQALYDWKQIQLNP